MNNITLYLQNKAVYNTTFYITVKSQINMLLFFQIVYVIGAKGIFISNAVPITLQRVMRTLP